MPPAPVFIATRGSPLALAQANLILGQCRVAFPDLSFALKIIKTTGDELSPASIPSPELSKGYFTKELELALLSGEADLAVHSLKDLPTDLPPGLKLGAVGPRADARDVLIYRAADIATSSFKSQSAVPPAPAAASLAKRGFKPHLKLGALPPGATIATGSPRRRAQLLEQRADLNVVPIRGNVGTRLKKLAEQPSIDGLVLATAGLERLGIELNPDGRLRGEGTPDGLLATRLELEQMLPCVGQAALGIEVREKDARAETICARLNHFETEQCVRAERAFLKAMGGGCQLAVAACAVLLDEVIWLRAVSFLGGRARRAEARGPVSEAVELGRQVARQLGGRP